MVCIHIGNKKCGSKMQKKSECPVSTRIGAGFYPETGTLAVQTLHWMDFPKMGMRPDANHWYHWLILCENVKSMAAG